MLSSKVDDVIHSVAKNAVCIKGILASPVSGDRASINYQLRYVVVVSLLTCQKKINGSRSFNCDVHLGPA